MKNFAAWAEAGPPAACPSLTHPMCERLSRYYFLLLPTTWRGVPWWVDNLATISPFLGLPIVLRGLRGALGDWCGRGFLSAVLTLLVYRRVAEICGKMERLAVRFAAGRVWRIVGRTEAQSGAQLGVGGAGSAGVRGARVCGERVWPARFAWLVRMAGYRAAGFGEQLRVVLEREEMVEFFAAVPQARRILRPVCRMLGLETTLLRPRAVVLVVAPVADLGDPVETVATVGRRVRGRLAPVDFGRIPLPRGVLAAARRQGFGKRF